MKYDIRDTTDISEVCRMRGSKWFSPDTLAFFGTRVHLRVYRHRLGECYYFVTSEQDSLGTAWNGERRFTVRAWSPDWVSPETVGDFGQYASRSGAHHAAARLAGHLL